MTALVDEAGERAALMHEAGVPRLAWRRRLWQLRDAPLPVPQAPPATPDPRVLLDERAPLGRITSRVSPTPAQLALPTEPAQYDFEGLPLSLAPSSEPSVLPEQTSRSSGQRDLFDPEQLELPFQQQRRARYRLRNALRFAGAPRQAHCGSVRIAPTLEILRGDDGRMHFAGLLTCGSVWSCPTCSAAIRTERAVEVQRVVEWHGQEKTFLLTLTLRHARRDDLRSLRAAIARAWRRFQTGAPWQRFRAKVGFVGSVRALEVTHGPAHGWHPHLHVLLLVEDVDALEREREWLQERWRAAVARELGERHAPRADDVGADLRRCFASSYVAKLGLELASDATKAARGENRNPWQIAHDVASSRAPSDVALWRAYCAGVAGARMLTWSKGLRELAGVAERADEDIARDPAKLETKRAERRVAVIAGASWDSIRRRVPHAGALLLLAAERGQDVGALVARLERNGGP